MDGPITTRGPSYTSARSEPQVPTQMQAIPHPSEHFHTTRTCCTCTLAVDMSLFECWSSQACQLAESDALLLRNN
eukprot:1147112-Pelagomonas_calceolata.AAC.4